MNIADLIAQEQQLARPCALLKRAGSADQLAGVWAGDGVVSVNGGPYRHWLSIDCRFLPPDLGPREGVLSIYTNEDDCESGVTAFGADARIPHLSAQPIYAHPSISFPPPDALAGGDDERYLRYWQTVCPMYTGDAVAVLGGWHFPWPDGDWEELRNHSLIAWTLDESEPWVEVWKTPNGYRVMQRIT